MPLSEKRKKPSSKTHHHHRHHHHHKKQKKEEVVPTKKRKLIIIDDSDIDETKENTLQPIATHSLFDIMQSIFFGPNSLKCIDDYLNPFAVFNLRNTCKNFRSMIDIAHNTLHGYTNVGLKLVIYIYIPKYYFVLIILKVI